MAGRSNKGNMSEDARVGAGLYAPVHRIRVAGETTVPPAVPGNSFQFIFDTRDGTRLGFALANDSDVDGPYTVVARDQFNNLLDVEFDTLNAHSQVSRFIDQIVVLPPGFVGSIEVIGVSGGRNYAVGLQFTGSVFATVQPVVRASPLRF